MRLLPTVLNPPAIVDRLTSAGYFAEMRNVDSPGFHIFVDVDGPDRDVAFEIACAVDDTVTALD